MSATFIDENAKQIILKGFLPHKIKENTLFGVPLLIKNQKVKTMLFRTSALALALIPSLTVSAFVAHPSVTASRVPSTTSVHSTVSKELIPPRDLEEVTNEIGSAQALYDNVQKTYG